VPVNAEAQFSNEPVELEQHYKQFMEPQYGKPSLDNFGDSKASIWCWNINGLNANI
jgi:hypothetical protein